MRIDALHLDAFGPFTDRRIDLGDGAHGVHVLYGPNEAGKSSALRALRALLFGFPMRSDDAFVHGYEQLRVGAELRTADGARLACWRRKGTKNTLLGADGEPLADDTLAALLGGVDEASFTRLFGIDHASLVDGGEALIREHGREAEALFGAGLGTAAVHEVRKALDDEADALFRPAGRKPEINALVADVDRLRREERERSLPASRYDEARRERDRARRDLDETEVQYREAKARHAALTRVHATLAPLARRARLLATLAALEELPELPAEFAERRTRAAERRRLADETRRRADDRRARAEQQVEAIEIRAALLDEADAIDALYRRVDVIAKAAGDRPHLDAERQRHLRALAELRARLPRRLRELDAAGLGERLGRQRRAEELAAEAASTESALADAGRRLGEREAARERCRERLAAAPQPGDVSALKRAVHDARRAGDLDSRIDSLEADSAAAHRDVESGVASLGRWARAPRALRSAALPDEPAVERFVERADAIADARRRVERDAADARERREVAADALELLERAGAPPHEDDLERARRHRDEGWRLLRARWVDEADVADALREWAAGGDAHDAFEAAGAAADTLADRLRREASKVHERAAETVKRDGAVRAIEALDDELGRLRGEAESLDDEWSALWQASSVDAGEPREMARWLRRAEALRERMRDVDAGDVELERRRAERARLVDALREALGRPADDGAAKRLAPLLDEAEQRIETAGREAAWREREREKLAALDGECRTLESERAEAERMRERWREQWSALTGALGLDADAAPGDVRDHFELLRAIVDASGRADELGERIAGIDADAERFDADAASLVRRVAPELESLAATDAVNRLDAELRRERERRKEREERERQRRDAAQEADEARAEIEAADAELAALAGLAGGVPVDALEDVERRDRERREARRALDEVEAELEDLGHGVDVETMRREAAGVDPDGIAAELAARGERIERELEPRMRELAERKVNAERDFDEMTGGSDAAALAEQREQRVSEIGEAAERYVRLRLASRVLRDQIERFRSEHRDPILAAAGRYFATLTHGAFESVSTGFDASDEPVLVAVRDGGERLGVEALSTGTRDQLYFALRLAALDHYVEHSEPLPLIADDVLVQFDDERTRAALETLAEFSRRTQVLLFTHHASVAEQAGALADAGGGILVHEI